ncbi:hypothetical protein [Paenibacillus sp. ACRRY]|uniref:hypothetical protein n=1 Tax=Paenibacillus sp. ACRRY TaxID=2918208 RepID=UPI001EF6F561|nr:hypothetical protein [Paenibacillus sp. ACRRY]MCG7381530.1 hypothetical protein [Paenibacillus sp. ACRRY]
MNEEQFKRNYKRAVDQMKTSDQMKKRMEQISNVQHHKQKRQRKPLYIAASVVIAASIGLAAPSLWQQWNVSTPSGTQVTANVSYDPVVIPKTELPNSNSSGPKASMLQLVVYQGNVYTQSPTSLNGEDALALRGEKLGTTTGGINELSSQDEYKELASNIGEADIYMVNGYNKDFRIMSYTELDGQVFAQLFDKNNGITIGSGDDLFGKLHLEGNMTSAQWETFESWNNGLSQLQPLAADPSLERFISALYESKPLAMTSELEERLYGQEDRKIIYLALEDKTQVPLVLFKEGLVRYGNVPVVFEVEEGVFQTFWNGLGK